MITGRPWRIFYLENVQDLAAFLAQIADFERRMADNPQGVTDEEIQEFYGSAASGDELRELSKKNPSISPPKNIRASVNAKLRRRLVYLKQAVSEVEYAIADVFDHAAPAAQSNREKKLNEVTAALGDLRKKLDWEGRDEDIDFDIFERLLNKPPYSSETFGPVDGPRKTTGL